jgi:hypothetical protein
VCCPAQNQSATTAVCSMVSTTFDAGSSTGGSAAQDGGSSDGSSGAAGNGGQSGSGGEGGSPGTGGTPEGGAPGLDAGRKDAQ